MQARLGRVYSNLYHARYIDSNLRTLLASTGGSHVSRALAPLSDHLRVVAQFLRGRAPMLSWAAHPWVAKHPLWTIILEEEVPSSVVLEATLPW